ncbi:MAG: tyrosine-type recombinase/integrase [Alphaproteobacteria bacterium]
MARGKITAETVNDLKPEANVHFLWDDKIPGFGVKVTPSGQKVYVLQYRLGGRGHKTKRYTIGKEGAMRPAKARGEAERLYALVKQGQDIAGQAREAKRIAVDLAFKPYVEAFCDSTLKAEWPKSWAMTKRCLEIHAVSHWGDKPLPDITAADCRQLLRKLNDRPATRRNLFAALSFLFNKSVKEGAIAVSPLVALDPPKPVAERTRILGDEELRWLCAAVEQEEQPYRGIAEHLVLWGARRGEVAGLAWAELNRERREWHLPAERAKNGCDNIIPLTDRVIAKLDERAGGDKWPRSGLVFASRAGTVPSGFSKLKRRLHSRMAKEAAKVEAELRPWRLHDIRRTVATNLQRLGVRHEVVEHLLNHREKARTGIAKVYQTHDFKAEKLAALQRWENELERIVSGEDAKVIPLRVAGQAAPS